MTKGIGGLLIACICLLCTSESHSQENVTTVGFQIKPIVETGIIGSGSFLVDQTPISAQVNPKTGMSFGMVIRRGLSKSISFEAGINRVTRNFQYLFRDDEIGFEESLDFGYINYEIPLKALVFVQLGDKLFLNNSLGPSIDMYASDVTSGDVFLQQITRRGAWVKIALEANLGLEYRTRKSGYFYFGATYHNPFSNVARSSIRYRDLMSERYVSFDLDGGYLTLDFKYYFHEDPERK